MSVFLYLMDLLVLEASSFDRSDQEFFVVVECEFPSSVRPLLVIVQGLLERRSRLGLFCPAVSCEQTYPCAMGPAACNVLIVQQHQTHAMVWTHPQFHDLWTLFFRGM